MNNIIEHNTAMNVIKQGNNCLLGVIDENNNPYIVPLNYYVKYNEEKNIISIISKSESKKVKCISNNNKVSLYFKSEGFADIITVIASGNATITNKDDMSFIDIEIKEISGRYFT